MEQLVGLAVAWLVGVVACTLIAHRITVHLGLPWRTALMYFGVVPYPQERIRRARPGRRPVAARPGPRRV